MVGLDGSAEENEAGWNDEEANLVVCTVPMMLIKAKASQHSKTARKRKKGERATAEDKAAELLDKKTADAGMVAFVERFDFLVFDESSAMRSRDSLIFNFLDRVGEAVPFRYLLTGTPMDSDPQELWPQFKIVDRGWSLGETITMFREAFFNRSKSRFGRFAFDYVLKRGAMKLIHRRTRHCSIRYEAREHKQMPTMIGGLGAKAFNNRFVDLPPATTRIYNNLVEEIRAARGDERAVEQNYIRMRQVCSGYMSLPDDLDKIQVTFPNNPKVDSLLELLEQLPDTARVLVACWYQPTARLMEKALAKYKPWRIDGSVPAKARKVALNGFRSGGEAAGSDRDGGDRLRNKYPASYPYRFRRVSRFPY
jgi:SNF2 family DNA or RNA helicase